MSNLDILFMLPSVTTILSTSIHSYRRHTGYFIRYMAIFFLISLFFSFAQDVFENIINRPGLAFLVFVLTLIAGGVVTLWLNLGLLVASKHALDEQTPEPFTLVMKRVYPLLPRVVIVSVVTSLLVGMGGLALVVPGLIMLVWYAFSTCEVLFFNTTPMAALTESKRLVVGRWWEVAWRLFFPLLTFGIVGSIVEILVLTPFSWPNIFSPPLSLGFLFANAIVLSILFAIIWPMISLSVVQLFFALKNNLVILPPTPDPDSKDPV